ncbi:aquaporin-7-like [Clytia hemisphaerica]|uniref:Uncharacterized protein n=1 Tax=Clytia hemisphaerica TaxID=252671 RepID=A0A7M5WSS6_9CNID|eukprot:TCONS_00068545-protein
MDNVLIVRYGGRTNQNLRLFLAELMGTFILMMFGIGSVAALVLGKGAVGTFLSVNFGWGIGCALGVYWSAGISGGHINPAVTLAMCVCGRLPWKQLPVYWAAQFLGSFIASALCFAIYKDLIYAYETQLTLKTAGIFSTYPFANVSHGTAFGDQVVGTMLLVGTVCALTDKRNSPPSGGTLPLIVGLVVFVIGISFGINCGYGINPARDLIPRIFTAIAGWGSEPFTTADHWFWIPIVGQFLGGAIGALLYILTIEMHHPNQHKPSLLKSESVPTDYEKSAV